MTDFAPEGVVDSTPTGEAPADLPTENVSIEEQLRIANQRWEQEKQGRIKERERYKPVAQAFENLHPDDARAISDFVRAYAAGDTDTATRWMIDNARTLAGDKFDTLLTPQQEHAITQQAIQDGQQALLTPDQVQKLIDDRLAAVEQAQTVRQYEAQIEATLVENGYTPDSPLATAAIIAASKRSDLDLVAALREVEDEAIARAQDIIARRQNAATSMGSPTPNGVAAVNNVTAGMTPRQRALARLEQSGL